MLPVQQDFGRQSGRADSPYKSVRQSVLVQIVRPIPEGIGTFGPLIADGESIRSGVLVHKWGGEPVREETG